jgi:hypothetical protein
MKPFGVRSVEGLGDDWERYKGQYRPQGEATREQSQRVLAFARLVHQASDDEFNKEIDSFLDVDEFLRFLAANALTSNLQSAFALGHNYSLYLNPKTNKFVFLPGDLEFALANFLLMGSADQLMDLSLTRPYPGDHKLVERLLAIKEVSEKYHKLLRELAAKDFTRARLTEEIEAVEKATREPLAREKKAAEARKDPPAGFGPPGGAAPQPPDLRTFAEKRTASVADQLADKSKGFVPRPFGFGPPGGGGRPGAPNQPIDERTFRDSVKAPDGFDLTLFAAPPKVAYPVALAAAPTGELFVAVDEQGSIGRTPGGGKILRCLNIDGDGKVDEVTVFAKVDHPRGLVYQDGSLWVLHPPLLSVHHDGGKGVADRSEVLVTGLTSDMIDRRGGDHTTNGIRMGLDGWIYIAVGDYGCPEARGKDGSKVTMRGGILRVRPDGTDLEVFATGLRNPFDIGIDPFMDLFTRDNNDNRPGGWDIRVSHLMQGAYYGYSQHYANFPDEVMPPLGQFAGGTAHPSRCRGGRGKGNADRGPQGGPRESQPDRQHALREGRPAGAAGPRRRREREGTLQGPVVRRLPHRRGRTGPEGAAPGGHRQALQERRAGGVDPPAQRQDRPGIRDVPFRDDRRESVHRVHRQPERQGRADPRGHGNPAGAAGGQDRVPDHPEAVDDAGGGWSPT